MKKVLIITYHFPPDASMGAVRPAKFAKYLPGFGWEPIIYTVKEKYYASRDESKIEPALKGLTVYRGNMLPGPLQLYPRLIHRRAAVSGDSSAAVHGEQRASRNSLSSVKRLISSIARIPGDDKQGWIFNILIDGYRMMKKHGIDAFITSGPPMSTHLGGLLLKYATGAKWVADFRDSWMTSPFFRTESRATNVSDRIEDWLKLRVLLAADLLVSTCESPNQHLRSLLPDDQKNKCHVITNGFDEADFLGLDTSVPERTSRIKVTHAGTLYGSRNPEPLLVMLSDLFNRGDLSKERVEIDLVGESENWHGVPLQVLIDKYDLGSVVHAIGRVSSRESLERMARSNALLLFAQAQPWAIPAKVFDYLRFCKPIFAIADEGDTKRLLQSFKHVFIADPNDIQVMRQSFLAMIDSLNNGAGWLAPEDQVKAFDRRALTEKLVRCLG